VCGCGVGEGECRHVKVLRRSRARSLSWGIEDDEFGERLTVVKERKSWGGGREKNTCARPATSLILCRFWILGG